MVSSASRKRLQFGYGDDNADFGNDKTDERSFSLLLLL